MVDNLNPSAAQDGVNGPIGNGKGVASFLSTTKGRLVVGAVVLILVLAALAAIVFLFFLRPAAPDSDTGVLPAGSVTATATAAIDTEEAPAPRRAKPLSSTFVFRDVFEPAIKPMVESASADGSSSGTSTGGSQADTSTGDDGTVDVPQDTLFLESISTVDSVQVANLIWNDQTYAAAEGEQLGDTPWEVLDISGNSVVMLFGDTRVTLTVGQGVSK